MPRLFILLFFLGTLVSSCKAKASKTEADSNYQDFVIINDCILGLTPTGKIKVYSIARETYLDDEINNSADIIAIAKDRRGNLVIADKNKEIKRYDDKQKTWAVIASCDSGLLGIVFDNKNSCYAITTYGILDLSSKKYYFTNDSLSWINLGSNKWTNIQCFHIDKYNNIWIGFNYGEWGTDLLVFNCNTRKFVSIPGKDVNLPISSFFEDSAYMYFSSTLGHLSMRSGNIVRFKNFKSEMVFNSENRSNNINANEMEEGNIIDCATYNRYDDCIYFYSQLGFFKGDKKKDLSKFANWKAVLKPDIIYRSLHADPENFWLYMSKITFIDKNYFVFLSSNYGIGYYNGSEFKMLR